MRWLFLAYFFIHPGTTLSTNRFLDSMQKPIVWYHPEYLSLKNQSHMGDPIAQYRLGLIYERGTMGTVQSLSHAISWFEEAALAGHPGAKAKIKSLSLAVDI